MRQMKRGHYEEDQFQSSLHKAMKYIIKHRDVAIMIAATIIIGGGIIIYSSSRGEKQNPDADMLHTQAMSLISLGRFDEAENILLNLTTKYKGSRAGKIGVYYLGVIKYHTGKFDEALQYFNEFLHLAGSDYLLAPSAHYGAACAAEGLKDYQEAQVHYKKVISNKKSPFYFSAALSYARVTGLLGEKDEAKKLLKDLLDQDPPADIALDAQFYIGYFSN